MVDNDKIVWFEVLTPKQAMLFLAIGQELRKFGFACHYTTRDHDYILDIFKAHKIQPISFGHYGGKSLEDKLLASVKRVVKLSENIISLPNKPAVAISFSSPDASRVAFGLGIPLILMNDTAHSKPVAKLTFALANYLLTPSCIPKEIFTQLGANPETMFSYDGVDEIEYIAGENQEKFLKLREQAVEKDKMYLAYRPEESYASYMKDKDSKPYLEILEHIIESYNGKVVVFPRYDSQREIILEKFEGQIEIPSNGFYFLNLLSNAEIVITGGGTMAREAALLGVPSITYFWRHLEPQKFIEDRGFPSFSVQSVDDTKKLITKLCSNPRKYWIDTSSKLQEIQKPSEVLIPLMKNDHLLKQYFN
ncbi:MAG: DUF354 domain-containing protein [Candidatus Heimdallarchaeota archaeon]